MLDNLVESSSHASENAKRGGFLLTTLVVVFALFFGGILWSLFAKDFGIGGEDLELSNLVAPVPVADEPPPPEVKPKVEQQKSAPDVDKRINPVQNENDAVQKIPDKPSAEKTNATQVRQGVKTIESDVDSNGKAPAPIDYRGPVNTDSKGIAGPGGAGNEGGDADAPPPKKETPKPTPTAPPVPKIVSGGVVNGKAVNLVKPPYPPAARAVHASGTVNVQVTIDENGSVIAASAVSGHPLLKQAAEQAARASKFSPTLLSGQKVKVTGVIVYNFTAQ